MRQSDAVITEDFEVIFDDLISETMRKIRCNTLARVIEVNDKLVSVQPIIREGVNTPEGVKYLKLPVIRDVYCISNQSPQVGDYVACLHFDRGIENFDIFNELDGYIDSGTNRHDLMDCVAVVLKTKSNRLGEFSGSTNVPELINCKEVNIKVLENGVQMASADFYSADGSIVNMKIPQAEQGTVITLDFTTGNITVPQNYSVVIYIK